MANSIDALKEQLKTGELQETALAELEAQHTTGDAAELPALFNAYKEIAEEVTDAGTLRLLQLRLVGLLDKLLVEEANEAVRGTMRSRKAALLVQLDDGDAATRELTLAFQELPDEAVLEMVAERLGIDGESTLHATVLAARVQLASEPARRADAARSLGTLRLAGQQLAEAAVLFAQVLEIVPEDPVATEGLQSIEGIRQDRQEMLEALRADAGESDGQAKAAALLALAEALLEEDEDSAEAAKVLKEGAAIDPANGELAVAYVQLMTRAGRWADIRRIGEAWAAATKGEDHFEAVKTSGLALLGGEKYLNAAVELLTEAHGLKPADAEVMAGLDRGLTQKERWDELVAALQASRKASRERNVERQWLVREAEIVWRELGQLDQAEKMFRRVRASDPRDMTALLFYQDYLSQKEDYKRLHAILSQKFTLVDKSERVEVATQMADLAEHRMGNLSKAIEAYKRVLLEDPGNIQATEHLVELYEKTGKWHALIEFLNSQIRRLGEDPNGERKVALLFQIIDVYQDPDRLPVEEMVIHTYSRIVQLSPTNIVALDNLAQRYEDARRWSELVQVLQKKIAATTDAEQLLDLFHQIADLYLSKMSSEGQAIPFLERILELDPTNLDVVRKLRSIYKAKHNLERLYGTYEAELKMLEGKKREPVLTELAVLATEKLYWHEQAITHWEELLELSPNNQKAVTSLHTLYAQNGRWESFVTLLETLLTRARTKRKRVEVLEKLGQIQFEKLGQIEESKATYRAILEINAHNASARKSLQRILISGKEWDELKALYAEHEDWRGYVKFLDESLADEDDLALKQDIVFELASVFETKLKDSKNAVARLSALLKQDPENVEVAAALDERYAQLEQPEKRLAVLSVLAEFSERPADGISALETGVELLVGLKRASDAFDWARRAVDRYIDEGTLNGVERLERVTDASDRWDDLAAWYGEAESRVGDIDQRKELLRRHALLLRDRLRKNAEAIEVFEELSQLDESDQKTLTDLEELTRLERDWEALQRVLDRRIQALAGKTTKKAAKQLRACRLQLGELYEDILDDPDESIIQYRAVLEAAPGDSEAVEGLDRIFQLEDRWEDLLGLLDTELARAEDDSLRVGLLGRIARILHTNLNDPDGATDRLEEALTLDPADDEVNRRLNALFDAGENRERVGLLLAPVLRRLGHHARLVEVLTDRLSRTAETAARRGLLAEIALIREENLSDQPGAFALRAEHVALEPGDVDARAELERLATRLQRFADVASLYAVAIGLDGVEAPLALDDHVVRVEDAGDETTITRRLAEIYEAHVEDYDRAVVCYERVRNFAPEDMDVLGALERLHARREDWESLLAIYRDKVELTWEVEDKKAVYLDICQLLREELERPEDAIAYYRSFLELDEGNLDVIGELEELYAEYTRWEELVDLLRRKLGLVETADRLDILFELAVVFRDRLEDVERAVQTFATILTDEPDHDEAIGALEQLLLRQDLPDFEQFAPRVADIIQPWFHEKGEWVREIGVLKVRAELAVQDSERAEILYMVGLLHEEKGQDDLEAFTVYSDAFTLDPANGKAESALQRTAGALECWADWSDVLEAGIRDDEPDVAVPLLMKLGAIARGQLEDGDRAIAAYERLLSLEPTHPGAMRALDDLFAQAERPADRVAILERRAEGAEEETSRRQLLFEVGKLHHELGNIEEAIEGFAYVAEHGDAVHETIARDALDRLQELYQASEQWINLCGVLLKKGEVAPDEEERKYWLASAAEVQEQQLDNAAEAVVLFERVRELDPTDEDAFDNLARLLMASQRWDDLEDLYLDARTRATEDDAADRFDFMLGQLYDHRLERHEDAVDRYEAILDRKPTFATALSSLEDGLDRPGLGLRSSNILVRAYTANDDADKLTRILTARLERWPDEVDLSATHIQLAQLLEHRFDDKAKAFEALCQAALNKWSEPASLRQDLVRLAGETEGWDDLEVVDREVLQNTVDKELRITVLTEMARVARDERKDLELAESIYREVLDEDPANAGGLEALRAIFEETERWADMVDILRLQSEFATEPTERVATLYQIGAIQLGELSAHDDAVDTYEQILAAEPDERDAYRQMESIYAIRDDWDAVVGVLGRELDVLDDAQEVTESRRRMARILYDEVQDRDRALDEATMLLEADTDDVVGLNILEACHQEGHAYDRVLRQLIPLYEEGEVWDKLVGLYARHVEESDLQGQVWALEQIRKIQVERLDDAHSAFDTLMEIVRLTPEQRPRWAELEAMGARQQRHAELAAFYASLLKELEDPEFGVALALRTAAIFEKPLGDIDQAIAMYRYVLGRETTNEKALAALSGLFEAHQRWADLVVLKDHAAGEALDQKQRQQLLFDQARLYEGQLKDPVKAADALEKVLDEAPENREALARLEGLWRELERWDDVEELYRRWLEVAEAPDESTAVRYRLAIFFEEQRDDADQALEELARVVDEKPTHVLTTKRLELLLDRLDDAAQQARAADLLERVFPEDGSWERWASIYSAQLVTADDTETQMLLHNQLGTLYLERAEDSAAAFSAYASAFALDFGNPDVEPVLESLADANDQWADLIAVYEAGLDDAEDALVTRYLARIGEIYAAALGDADGAAATFERLLEVDCENETALAALETHYSDAGEMAELARVLRLRLDATVEAEARVAVLYRVADIELTQLENRDNGIDALREVLSLAAAETAAKDTLERLYAEGEDWDDLVEIYRAKLEFADDDDDRIDLLSRIAQVQEQRQQSLEDAVVTYRDIIQLSPQNLLAITSLKRLFPEVGDWAGMLETLERERGLYRSPRDRVKVDFEIGALLCDRLDQHERALEHFRMVLEQQPGNPGVVAYLEQMLEVESVRMATGFVLEPIYEEAGAQDKMARLIEVQLRDAQDDQEKVELLRRLAEIRDRHQDDPDGAIEALGKAFLLDPHDDEVRAGLKTVADRSERWQGLADVYREALGTINDVDVTREVSGWLAEINEKHLGDLDSAIDRYREVLSYDEFNAEAAASLEALLERQGRWAEVVDVVRGRLEQLVGPAAREKRVKLAGILLNRVDDPESALDLYKELLWEDPNDDLSLDAMGRIAEAHPFLREAVIGILKPIHQGADRWDEVIRLMLLGVDVDTSNSDQARTFQQVGKLYEQRMSNPTEAFLYYRKALANDPTDRGLLQTLERMAGQLGRWAELGQLYDALLREGDDGDARLTLLLKAGQLAETQLDALGVAETRYREILDIDSESYDALDALERVYESQGKVRDLIAVCERKAELPIEVGERIDLYRKIAKSAQYRQDVDKAEQSWKELLDLDSSDVEALQALEALYRDKGDYERLAETMEMRSAVTYDSEALAGLKVELGRLRAVHMDDLRGASDAYEEALELDEGCLEALAALDEIYEKLGEYDEQARILTDRIELADGEATRLVFLGRLAAIEEGHLEMVESAITHYRAILDIEPAHEATIDELLRLYHKHERWEGLADAYERKIGLVKGSEQNALKIRAAEIQADRLGNLDRAGELAAEVLAAEPNNASALGLSARLKVAGDDPEEAIKTYEALLPTLSKASDKIAAHLALGKLYLKAWDNTAKALVCFRDALQLDESHPEASQLLKDVLYRRESWEALIPVLERDYGRAADRKALADIAYEIAMLQRDKLQNPDEAYRWLRAGYNAKRDHRQVVEALVEYYTERDNWADAAPLLGWLVSYLEAKRMYAELAEQAHRLGALFERVGDSEKALRYYQVANQYDSRNIQNLLAFGRLLYEQGKYEKALNTLQGLLLLQHDVDDETVKVQMFLYLAKACLATGDKSKAKRHLKRLLSLDGQHAEGNALVAKL